METLVEEFKRVYEEKGAHDFQSQIKYLSALADHYHRLGADTFDWISLLKAHALYNSVAVRDENNSVKWSAKAYEVQNTYWGKMVSPLSFEQQRDMTDCVKRELAQVRTSTRAELDHITSMYTDFDCDNLASEGNMDLHQNFMTNMEKVSEQCTEDMVKIFNLIIGKAVGVIGKPPCSFCTAALGSVARGEATPYSDLEFLFLIQSKSPELVKYFEDLAMNVYFLIGNLQETKLRYMAIEELSNWFEDVSTNGLKIDGLQKWAGNIPTGNGSLEQQNHFICTVDELVSRYKDVYNNPDPAESLRGDITAMLFSTAFVYGDKSLLERFTSETQCLQPPDAREIATRRMMENDIKKYDFYPDPSLCQTRNMKSDIYRYPSMLTANLSILHKTGKTSFSAITELTNQKKLSISVADNLRFTFCCALYIRLSAYLYHESQNERISVLSGDPDHSATKDQWSISRPLFLHMMMSLIPLKAAVRNDLLHANLERTITDLQYSVAFVSFHCDDLQRCYDIWRKLDPNRTETNINLRFMRSYCEVKLELHKDAKATLTGTAELLQHSPLRFCLLPLCYAHLTPLFVILGEYGKAEEYQKMSLEIMLPCPLRNIGFEASACGQFGLAQMYQGKYDLAEQWLTEAARITQSAPVISEDPGTNLRSCTALVDLYCRTGRYDKAEKLCISFLEKCRKTYGPTADHGSIAQIYYDLCDLYWIRGQYQKAVEYGNKSLNMYQRLSGNRDNMEVAICLSAVGTAYQQQQCQYQTAELNLTRALEMMQRIRGESDDGHIMVCLDRLGSLYADLGNETKAESYYTRSLDMVQRLHKTTAHPHAAVCCINLGIVYQTKGQYRKAERYIRQSLKIRDQLNGSTENPGIIKCYNALGRNHLSLKEHDQAELCFNKAMSMCQRLYKNCDDPDVARCSIGLARCYCMTSRLKSAFYFALKSLNMLLRLYNSDTTNSEVLDSFRALATAYLYMRYELLTFLDMP